MIDAYVTAVSDHKTGITWTPTHGYTRTPVVTGNGPIHALRRIKCFLHKISVECECGPYRQPFIEETVTDRNRYVATGGGLERNSTQIYSLPQKI